MNNREIIQLNNITVSDNSSKTTREEGLNSK